MTAKSDNADLLLQSLNTTVQTMALDIAQIKTTLSERCGARGMHIERLDVVASTAHKRIDELETKTARNTTIVAIVTAGLVGAVTWVVKSAIGK